MFRPFFSSTYWRARYWLSGLFHGLAGFLIPTATGQEVRGGSPTPVWLDMTNLPPLYEDDGSGNLNVAAASLVPGTGATNLGKAEDAPHTSGDVGVLALAVRQDTAAALAGAGDYIPLIVDAAGLLHVRLGARSSSAVAPANYTTTNAFADVTGSTLDTLQYGSVSYTLVNAHAGNVISWKVLAAHQADFSDAVEVKASADVAALGTDSYSATVAVWRYYKVQAVSKVADTPGTAVVRGLAKG